MTTNRIHFTKAAIEALPTPTEGALLYNDEKTRGLSLRVSAQGTRTWNIQKWSRAQRKPVRMSIGPYPSISVEMARRKAVEVIAALDQGRDLQEEKRAKHATPTLGELCNSYSARLKAMGRRQPNYLREIFRLSFKDWTNRRATDLTQREISERHDAIASTRGKMAAGFAVKALRTLLAYAATDLGLDVPNVARAVRVQESKPRQRFLSPAEERKLLQVLTAEQQYVEDYFRLLLLTGARRDNVAGLRWADVNLGEALWTIPADAAKAGRAIAVPLMPEAVEILQRRKAKHEPTGFCFPTYGKAKRLVQVWQMVQRVKARAVLLDLDMDWQTADPMALLRTVPINRAEGKGLTDITVHDLRRTVAVKLVGSGASLPVIAAALGHRNLKTTQQVYALATTGDVRAAMERMIK